MKVESLEKVFLNVNDFIDNQDDEISEKPHLSIFDVIRNKIA